MLRRSILGLLAALPQAACAGPPRPPAAEPQLAAPPALDDGWRTAAPDSLGLDARRLAAMTEAIRRQDYENVHAVLIERDGRLVYEEYFVGVDERWGDPLGRRKYHRDAMHDVRSISKSVTSALLGIALGATADSALERPLLDYFPEHGALATPARRAITLRHALTMTAGFDWLEVTAYPGGRQDEVTMLHAELPLHFALGRDVVTPPGTTFNYNGGLTQLVAEVIERTSGRPLLEYARAVLFEPLGIRELEWLGDIEGTPSAASGLRLRARDLAKFGSLYLHAGRWNQRQVIPADWVAASTRRRVAVSIADGWDVGYGYYWWHGRMARPRKAPLVVYGALGNGEQKIFVVPELRLVVTILAGSYYQDHGRRNGGALLRDHIVPAAGGA